MKFSATRSADSSAARVTGDEQHRLAGSDARAVFVLDADRDLCVEQPKRLERERNAADDAALARDERRARAAIGDDRRDRRDVVERAVLLRAPTRTSSSSARCVSGKRSSAVAARPPAPTAA